MILLRIVEFEQPDVSTINVSKEATLMEENTVPNESHAIKKSGMKTLKYSGVSTSQSSYPQTKIQLLKDKVKEIEKEKRKGEDEGIVVID